MIRSRNLILFGLFLAGLGISACSTPQTAARSDFQGGINQARFPRSVDKQFPVLPFPPQHAMDRDRSFIFESGQGEIKVGGIHLNVSDTPDSTVSFYRTEMKNNGWRLIQMVDHRGTIMLYELRNLICTIIVEPSADQSLVIIHIGPK